MLKFKTGMRFGRLFLGSWLVVGLAGPALAGNVYAWVTEDGTHAFTDDAKRIPAKYRAEANRRPMGKLTRYERYTEVSSDESEPYAARIVARRDQLRENAVTVSAGRALGASALRATGLDYTLAVSGGTTRAGRSGLSLDLPLGGGGHGDSQEPTHIESRRMDPSDSMATRHWTVVKQGDRVVSVIKGERRQQPLKALSEPDSDR